MRLARPAPGDRVLGIATGTGNAAEAAVAAVGPSGHVTAVDDMPAMIEQARQRLDGVPNVTFAIGHASALTFANASFDVVLCSMALMIFPEREHALSGFRRVMREGGRLSVSINTRPERSITGAVRMAVARQVPSIEAAMAHHYSLNNADRLCALLTGAGSDPSRRSWNLRVPLPVVRCVFRAVRAGGHVTAVDDMPAMIEQARQRLDGVPNVTFAIGHASALTFANASFDVVLCSMALMIFPEREHALSGFRRVMRGRGAALRLHQHSPGTLHYRGGAHGRCPPSAVNRGGDGTPLFAQQRRSVVRAANRRGIPNSVETVMETRAFHFPSFDAYFEPFEQGGGPWGSAYAGLSSEARRAAREDVRRILAGNMSADGGVTIEADILFGCGTK